MAVRPTSTFKIPIWSRLTPRAILWFVVALSTFLGATAFNRYGESWDEQVDFQYGEDAREYYAAPAEYWETYGHLKYYGPAYLALAHSVAGYIHPLFPNWEITDARHFVNHIAFQIATIALFYLCLRYVTEWPSLVASLLFATQPLLFGHSFINQKDAPFMAIFLMAAVLGFKLGDMRESTRTNLSGHFVLDWKNAATRRKLYLLCAGTAAALICSELLIFKAVVLPTIKAVVRMAYTGDAFPLLNEWFAGLAQNTGNIPLDGYLEKATTLYMGFRWPLSVLSAVPFLALLARTFHSSLEEWRRSGVNALVLSLAGGAVAGFATATRVLGFSVLGLVALPIVLGKKWKKIPLLTIYTLSCAAVCYAAWPYLHGAPISHLMESVSVMRQYPWSGGVLFMGSIFNPGELPWFYLLVLIGIQFTVPAILLAAIGIGAGTMRAVKDRQNVPELTALLVWLVAPIAAVVLIGSTLYGNFRQLLFVTPPLFVFAGMTLDLLLVRLRSMAAAVGVVALVLAPGILGIVRLHPYEYVYYNGLVGGVHGAFRSYELDYWCTSYREAMEWVNEAAPPQAEIAVAPPEQAAAHFARPDLQIISAQGPGDLVGHDPVFGLGCGRGNNDIGFFQSNPVAGEVLLDGARLTVVRDLRPPGAQAGR
jgi:4-amino-4-deoxy-L-arabinose transferase-like glycosyltransferase